MIPENLKLHQYWRTNILRKSRPWSATEIRKPFEIKEFEKPIAFNHFKLANESVKSNLIGRGFNPGPCSLFFSTLKEMEPKLGIILIAQTRPTWVILKHVKNEI